MYGVGLVRDLQERAARALPAERVERVAGWWLRDAPGCSWWVNTVLPHSTAVPHETAGPEGLLADRVAAVEEFYAARQAPARFQITPGTCPEGLDALLAGRGYRIYSPTSLQVTESSRILDRAVPPDAPPVRINDHPSPEWLEVWQAVNGGDPQAERALLGRVTDPCGYATAHIADRIVAVGRATTDTGWAGIFDMATLPQARGKGAATAVLTALAGWAATHTADRLYLQVQQANPAALGLYQRAGFREISAYHYRVAEEP